MAPNVFHPATPDRNMEDPSTFGKCFLLKKTECATRPGVVCPVLNAVVVECAELNMWTALIMLRGMVAYKEKKIGCFLWVPLRDVKGWNCDGFCGLYLAKLRSTHHFLPALSTLFTGRNLKSKSGMESTRQPSCQRYSDVKRLRRVTHRHAVQTSWVAQRKLEMHCFGNQKHSENTMLALYY